MYLHNVPTLSSPIFPYHSVICLKAFLFVFRILSDIAYSDSCFPHALHATSSCLLTCLRYASATDSIIKDVHSVASTSELISTLITTPQSSLRQLSSRCRCLITSTTVRLPLSLHSLSPGFGPTLPNVLSSFFSSLLHSSLSVQSRTARFSHLARS